MNFSKRIIKEAKSYNIEPQAVIMADLMSAGYTEVEAYNIAYAENSVLSFEQNQSIRGGLASSAKFKEMLLERKERLRNTIPANTDDETELMSTEEAARQVLLSAKALPEGSKERGEMFVKYTELLRKNTTVDAEPEDDSIRIYLPLKCHDCPLLQEYNERQKELEEKKKEATMNKTEE